MSSETPPLSPQQPSSANDDKLSGRRIAAPKLPPEGAITASPHTGSGPHKAPPVKVNPGEVPTLVPRQPKPIPAKPSLPVPPVQTAKPAASQPPVVKQVKEEVSSFQQLQHDPATMSLLMQVLNQQRQVSQKFYMVVLPDDGWPVVEEFTTVKELVESIKQKLGQPVYLFPFIGQQLTVTRGTHKFLQTPMGSIPLFDIPDPSATVETTYGWVGDDEECPQINLASEAGPESDSDDDNDVAAQDAEASETFSEDDTPVF